MIRACHRHSTSFHTFTCWVKLGFDMIQIARSEAFYHEALVQICYRWSASMSSHLLT